MFQFQRNRTIQAFRGGMVQALKPSTKNFEVTKAFFKEIENTIKQHPNGCILRCQNSQQKEAVEKYFKKSRLTQFTVRMTDESEYIR
jgi:hypothetical protein